MFQKDYDERVYAGVLGKVIGVYAGKPFEGWSYEKITEELGEINDYVHKSKKLRNAFDKMGLNLSLEGEEYPLVAVDDDISGTFTFIRALADHGVTKEITAKQIGNSWLNYLIEGKTVLWWGGLGNSTEHTAFLRLKKGVPAPKSGSKELNGKVVSEQIGAQIFIDGWGMVCPGDPELASEFAKKAGSVSHDGEAIYGAQIVAAMEALAFIEDDTNKILDQSVELIPDSSVIYRMIADIRNWHAGDDDWKDTFQKIKSNYGYDKYGGNCHMVPNHGLIIHSILHADDDFSEAMKIVNTCGWDTDCNSGNVGCYMGIKLGLEGIDASLNKGVDWRGPVADRMYMPTADGSRGITDCVTEALEISRLGKILQGESVTLPKNKAKFHFEFPGSSQGFTVDSSFSDTGCVLTNFSGNSSKGTRSLMITSEEGSVAVTTPVFITSKAIAEYYKEGYALIASPKIYPGQKLEGSIKASEKNGSSVNICLAYKYYDENDKYAWESGKKISVGPGESVDLELMIDEHDGQPVCQVGFIVDGNSSEIYVDYLTWTGEPNYTLSRPQGSIWMKKGAGQMWKYSWINALNSKQGVMYYENIMLVQNEGAGLYMQGTRDWKNYFVEADVTPHMAKSVGICARVQGMKRYYSLELVEGSGLQLKKVLDQEIILASTAFAWEYGSRYIMKLEVSGNKISGSVNGESSLEFVDLEASLDDGGIALLVNEGRTATDQVIVRG